MGMISNETLAIVVGWVFPLIKALKAEQSKISIKALSNENNLTTATTLTNTCNSVLMRPSYIHVIYNNVCASVLAIRLKQLLLSQRCAVY